MAEGWNYFLGTKLGEFLVDLQAKLLWAIQEKEVARCAARGVYPSISAFWQLPTATWSTRL